MCAEHGWALLFHTAIDSGPFSGSSLVAWAGVEIPAWAERQVHCHSWSLGPKAGRWGSAGPLSM